MKKDSKDLRDEARALYWRGLPVGDIATRLDIPYGTVYAWKNRDLWDQTPIVVRMGAAVDARLMALIAKQTKTKDDLEEMDRLGLLLERAARIEKISAPSRQEKTENIVEGSGKKKKGSKAKNAFTDEQVLSLNRAFERDLFVYQRGWLNAKCHRSRNILKSRQIGATWYFAREALIDAVTTGDNQIFLSASKAQAHVFKQYILAFVSTVTGIDLRGDPIVLDNGATLYFLGTNSKTAQSYHGHVYLDEYAWIAKFLEFRKVASAMATHRKWRLTYFSTPSTIGHEAHDFWAGEAFNKGRARDNRADFDVSHQALAKGQVGPDGQWRQMITVTDAEQAGCDLFDIDQLKLEYNDQDFKNLYLCEWVDDTASYFLFEELRKCMDDAWEEWADDFNPMATHSFGDAPVWIGYDPAESGDQASIVVVAPPAHDGGCFRVLEKLNLTGSDWAAQAEAIRRLTYRYRVTHIGIDATQIGSGVFELVRDFFPAAVPIRCSPDVKNRLVLKAKHLVSKGNLQFDNGWRNVCMAFMSIRRATTASGNQMTFIASRTRETGHADVAWAIMYAIDKMDFVDFGQDGIVSAQNRRHRSFVEFY